MPAWDSDLYLKYVNERTQPSIDLAARINVLDPHRIIDLGCGPGNSTAVLRHRWPGAEIIGLDNSSEMISAAAKAYPTEKWILADAASWFASEPFDIIFSNAAFQWLPDHTSLFPHLMAQLAASGVLAVQMPAHYDSPVHQVILEASNDLAWRDQMETARNALTKERPSFYYNLLQPICSRLDIWETEYFHVMDSPKAIVEWFCGTGLRPFLQALENKDLRTRFEQIVLDGYTQAYQPQRDGRILFPFRRLFLVAYAPAGDFP